MANRAPPPPDHRTSHALADTIDACLPQTQCTRCGYPRCRDYAQAIAEGESEINRCPPGGDYTLKALGQLLGRTPPALDPACGTVTARIRAVIEEDTCIGCRKCIDACPVDAIVGARKLMHTVIAAECTGCELCLPPCPVDCIRLVPQPAGGAHWPEYPDAEVSRWRDRADRHFRRLALNRRKRTNGRSQSVFPDRETIRMEIQAAIQRARARRR